MLHSLHTPVPVRHRPRRARALPLVVVLVLVLAAAVVAGALAVAAPGGPSWPGAASVGAGAAGTEGATGPAGGEVPSGASVFDDDLPAVTKLDPDLLEAVRRAARDAEGDGVRFVVNSGWRSAALQERLLDDAVAEYGSRDEAARWVSTPQTSLHVRGEAIDIGDWDAAEWLQDHGAGYGLCQVYDNEAWHFELRPEAPEAGCPRLYADPTADPRMQR
ncbi:MULTISPECIES: M15 family metallopeptidase [unclassified Curtobacterium]|uniref:M15 family metallopeptidase n=1 Tax=unclassified Curtobacterium TaxID=257496 RepID=UPI000826A4B2|nr:MULTISPECIES: M15 family metallopeptidase [unclassified Curtobacterium]WIA96176.1 M15 family metallopeptidase [Curtobacterium sp. MCBA15_004]